jgi:hypothetical protein
VQLDSLLEGIALLHDLSILDRDHTIVHIHCHVILLPSVLFLVLEASLAGPKWIHLVTLTHLVTERLHLILH